jgi:hypothetical protein
VREALMVFAKQKHLAAIEIAGYNPTKDPDSTWAKTLIDLLAEVLGERFDALKSSAPPAGKTPAAGGAATASSETAAPVVAPGEAWSPETLEAPSEAGTTETPTQDAGEGLSTESSERSSVETEDHAGSPHRESVESGENVSSETLPDASSYETPEDAGDANSE